MTAQYGTMNVDGAWIWQDDEKKTGVCKWKG